MKHKSIFSLIILLFGLGFSATSCEDMLTPDMDRYSESFSGKDTVNFYFGILRNVQEMVEQNELLGDLRSDLVATTEYSSDSISNIINYNRQADGENALLNRAAYYKVINQCNFYLAKVDTAAVKNNIYYMRKEYAQVVAIRAWTYLQLVQTYGRVPFITQPVDNADTGWETNPETFATAENLVDLLRPEMEKAANYELIYGYPSYGSLNTGYSSIAASYLRFYNDIILGDLYLLRGNDRSDYVNAAKHYYNVLELATENGASVSNSNAAEAEVFTNSNTGKQSIAYYPTSWTGHGLGATSPSSTENFTLIPSAANNSFGKVLLRVPQVYGFDATSTQTTDTKLNDDEEEESTTTGTVTLTVNYRSRQVAPSQSYLNLCAAQSYTIPTLNSTSSTNTEVIDVDIYDGIGDTRVYGTAPIIETSKGGKLRFVTKVAPASNIFTNTGYASSPQFKYFKSLYRLKQVWLRYAEAINRAGYPRLAFMILRDGVNFEKMPTIADSIHYDDVAETKQRVYYLDSSLVYNAANYIGVDELRRSQLDADYASFIDFSENIWENDGLHEQGCGEECTLDTIFTYDKVVSQRIADEALRAGDNSQEVAQSIRALRKAPATRAEGEESGEEPTEPTKNRADYTTIDPATPAEANPYEINAVETLIADECAMELAFEGTRMFDLIRFARHKNNDTNFAADYGSHWLAWKIARRAENLTPYESPQQYNATLYNLLLNADNWYILNPEY